jgi:2-polyprenyl-3-methyl-5-hydroxy-6-metoxy-1,4-benzoquinol methylase
MATDPEAVVRNLCEVYDFADKTVLSVGAGGGQFIEYGRRARRVIAVDEDPAAIRVLGTRVQEKGLSDRLEIVTSNFLQAEHKADAVLFEFCLHEIPDARSALRHAEELAPDVVVIDHAPDSQWAYYVDEVEKVEKSSRAIHERGVLSERTFRGEQRFADYAELYAKVSPQGEKAIGRISKFVHRRESIVIPMAYVVVVIGAVR